MKRLFAIAAASIAGTTFSTSLLAESSDDTIHYRTTEVGNVDIFYREAGSPSDPAVLLLHGWGASSFMFRNLIPLLAEDYYVLAPDLPGFGLTKAPPRNEFDYTFEALTDVIEGFTELKSLDEFAIYVHDYGAPVGFRLGLRDPKQVSAIITQNGNAYVDGLSDVWVPIQRFWADASQENRDALRPLMSLETNTFQYQQGVTDTSLIEPEVIALAQAGFDAPGNMEIQLDLFGDYQNNVALYPEFQEYFRTSGVPILAVWGNGDPFFLPAGAEAFRNDSPNATVRLYDSGHFALETHNDEIGAEFLNFSTTL